MITIKYIKFCKKFISESRSDDILDKYNFLLEREASYSVKKMENQVAFKKKTIISTDRSENIINAMKVFRKGIITIENTEKNSYHVCWQISISDIFLRSIISAILFSLVYYFYFSNNFMNTGRVFSLIFILTGLKNFIVLKFKVSYFNNSVF